MDEEEAAPVLGDRESSSKSALGGKTRWHFTPSGTFKLYGLLFVGDAWGVSLPSVDFQRCSTRLFRRLCRGRLVGVLH